MWSRIDPRPAFRSIIGVGASPTLVVCAGALSLAASAIVYSQTSDRAGRTSTVSASAVTVPHSIPRLGPPVIASTAVVARPSLQLTADDEWSRSLRDPEFWANRRSGRDNWSIGNSRPSRPSALGNPPPAPASIELFSGSLFDGFGWGPGAVRQNSGTYRTVCVRPCDGFYWPISFATTRSSFERDAAKCEASCSGAKLYVYRNPGEEADDMVDLRGQPYKKLATAFLYRTQYDAQCKCQPHPWEEASRLRHRIYALEAAARQGDRKAASELQVIRATERQARSDKRADAAASEGSRTRQSRKSSTARTKSAAKQRAVVVQATSFGGPVVMRLGATRQVSSVVSTRARSDDWKRAVYGR